MISVGASKLEGEIAQYEATEADLTNKLEVEREQVHKMSIEMEELRRKDEAKADQLKAISQMTVEVSENLSKMSFDEIKVVIRKIRQMSKPGYLPPPEEETADQLLQLPAATPKKPTSLPVRPTTTSLMRRNLSTRPQTAQQRNVSLRRPLSTTTKSTRRQNGHERQ